MRGYKIAGLVAAVHTPFDESGCLRHTAVEKQADHLLRTGVAAAFVAGSTGECHSLTLAERMSLTERWMERVRGTALGVVVHVGSNCLEDSRTLAAHAQQCGAQAIAALAPSYFKPRTEADLVDWCERIAEAAPETAFYFYDIPALTGVQFSMPEFLESASESVPTLAGLKFSNPDLAMFQRCLRACGGALDVLWGIDQYLLAALALGAKGAVGSTYNFAAPLYHRMIAAFQQGDLESAREEQYRSAELVALLTGYGYMGASKAVMTLLGVDVGPARPPNGRLSPEEWDRLSGDLERQGFFDRVTANIRPGD